MIKFLSSMRFAFWLLVSLIVWLFLGAMLTIQKDLAYAIKNMGNKLILDWLLEQSAQSPIILSWFIILCIIGALLAVSFLFCSWTNLYKVARKNVIGLLFFYFLFTYFL